MILFIKLLTLLSHNLRPCISTQHTNYNTQNIRQFDRATHADDRKLFASANDSRELIIHACIGASETLDPWLSQRAVRNRKLEADKRRQRDTSFPPGGARKGGGGGGGENIEERRSERPTKRPLDMSHPGS